MASPQPLDIPQFVIIRDEIHNIYKQPVLHYVFEDEEFPDVPKSNLIVVDLDDTATNVAAIDSYSPHFQVTNCRLEQSTLSDQLEDGTSLLNLTIDGVSAPKASEAIESLQPIRNVDSLKEMIFNFKKRNDMVKNVCASFTTDPAGSTFRSEP